MPARCEQAALGQLKGLGAEVGARADAVDGEEEAEQLGAQSFVTFRLNLVEEASRGLVMAPHQLFDLLFRRLASKHCEDTNAL